MYLRDEEKKYVDGAFWACWLLSEYLCATSPVTVELKQQVGQLLMRWLACGMVLQVYCINQVNGRTAGFHSAVTLVPMQEVPVQYLELVRTSKNKQADKNIKPRMLKSTSASLTGSTTNSVSWVAGTAWPLASIELCTWKIFLRVLKTFFCNSICKVLQHSQYLLLLFFYFYYCV